MSKLTSSQIDPQYILEAMDSASRLQVDVVGLNYVPDIPLIQSGLDYAKENLPTFVYETIDRYRHEVKSKLL
jgi:hypothetical protein